ncbi:unnamed protein product, partial [marine sediment metagenome]
SCTYGPRQFGTEDQGWVAHFIISSALGRRLTIYGDGKQTRDVLYIDDLIKALDLALRKSDKTKGKVYNIGGGRVNTISLLELVAYIEKLLNRKIDYSFAEWRPGDQKVYVSDIRKATEDFGWAPQVRKEEGIKKLLNWVTANRELFE